MVPSARRPLITGVTGQDGSYLTELLLGKGYEVHGLIRRSSTFSTARIDHLYKDPHEPDVAAHPPLRRPPRLVVDHVDAPPAVKPDEVYNLGAQSHVKVSFEMPEFTAETAGMGTLRMLEAIRHVDWPIRYYQAGSSEMFGQVPGAAADRADPVPPAQPVRGGQGLRPLDDGALPRGVRPVSPRTGSCSTTNRPAAARRS